MPTYDDIRKVANSAIPIGMSVSMPIPILRDERVLDVLFLYSVDRKTRKPRKPEALLEVDLESSTVRRIDTSKFFGSTVFVESDLKSPENYRELSDDAKSAYASMRGEFSRGVTGDATSRYAELVYAITQDSLMPFYEALAPSVFKPADSQNQE